MSGEGDQERADRWARLSSLFDQAVEQPAERRADWARASTADDPALRAELLRMLAAYEEPFGVLDRSLPVPRVDGESLLERLRPALSDRYVITSTLGRGGMATVFLARELKHDRNVVIKVLDPSAALAYGARRFHDEVRIAARLSHPHILALIDSGDADGLLYYVMPHIEGRTLRARLREGGRLTPQDGLPLLRDVADALAHAHSRGVIHRDLKPDNILCAAGHAYLLDFGVAKRAVSRAGALVIETDAGHAIGTPGYMSPEQASGQRVDARSDLYAWGLVATETLAGSAERGALDDAWVAPQLAQLVRSCLALEPADRPASAGDVVQALDALLGASTPTSVPLVTRAPRRTIAAAGALALVGALGAYLWTARTNAPGEAATRLPMPLAVAPLRNDTGDSTLTVWGRLASDWLTQGLEETGIVTVVPWASVHAVAQDATVETSTDLVQVIARESGAASVLSGSFYLVGDSMYVQLAVTDARTGASVGSLGALQAPRDSLSMLMRAMRERVQGFVALQLDERVTRPSAFARVPPTYEAYRAFDRGLSLYTGRQYRAAATELRESYIRDTTFVAPLIFAAMAHWNTGELEWTDTLVSVLRTRRDRLSPFADAMTTHLDALLASDAARALQAIEAAASAAPGLRAEYSVAHHRLAMNQPREALQALAPVDPDRGLMRGWQSYWTQIAHANHLLGDHASELAAATEMRRRYPQNRAAAVFAVRALAATDRQRETDALIDSLALLPADTYWSHGAALIIAAEERLEQADTVRAYAYLDRAITWFRNRLRVDSTGSAVLYWLGAAHYQRGDDLAAEQIFADLHRLHPEQVQHRGWHAVALARLGRLDEATAVLGEPPRYARGEHTAYRARVAAVSGDAALASALLEQTLREGFTGWPWFPGSAVRDFEPLREAPTIARVLPVRVR